MERNECNKEKELLLKILEYRLDIIKSEPSGVVRETMIDNLLIDL